MRQEFNFVGKDVSQEDRVLFLGPFDNTDGPFIDIEDGWIMAHVMHAAGLFTSIGQARKNGWDKPISPGFDMFKVGKRKIEIFTLTRFND